MVFTLLLQTMYMVDEGGNYYKSDSTLTKPEEKYYDKYEYNTDRLNNQIGHLGDATRETLNWYGDAAAFVNGTASWFGRGLHHNNPYAAGIFGIFSDTGQALVYASSRSIITGEDK